MTLIVFFLFFGVVSALIFLILGSIFLLPKRNKKNEEIEIIERLLVEFNRTADSWVEILDDRIKEGKDLEKRLAELLSKKEPPIELHEDNELHKKEDNELHKRSKKKKYFWQRGKTKYHRVFLLSRGNKPDFSLAKSLNLTKGEIDFIFRLAKRLDEKRD